MTGATEGGDEFAFDIGLGADGRPELLQSITPKRRKLPVWAVGALALLVGWILGTSLNAQPLAQQPAVQEQAAREPAVQEPGDPLQTQATSDTTEQSADVAIVMVQAPLRGVAIPADITVIEDGIATQIELDRLIAGATQGVIGQGDRRMLVVEDTVVFMALDAVMVFDPVLKTEPVEVAKAIYLLPGSEAGHVWAVSSGSHSVFDIDVRTQSVRAEYDLTNIGTPLASYSGGLVVAPTNRSFGTFGLWSPARGVERLWSIHEDTTFIGAAGNVLVVHTPQGLAAYNAVTGSLTQSDYKIPRSAQHRSIVSPDGSRLAIAAQGSVTELPTVLVVDTSTGQQIDHFDAAFAWQLQWVSPTTVLFMLPEADGVLVMLRDITTNASRQVTDLVGPNYWVTVTS